MTIWCSTLVAAGKATSAVRLTVGADGRIASVRSGVSPQPGDLVLGTVVPGFGNAHSHAFHRVLRGQTHSQGGDFWRWRERMYKAAATFDPKSYFEVARATFAEMVAAGWTAVGEFHYLHHRARGERYPQNHAMELALISAAHEVGIRLVLLDTSYLAGGFDQPLSSEQEAFSDGSAERWIERWFSLRHEIERLPSGTVPATLGAAIHSVRAVPEAAIAQILAALPSDVPLHVHLSEQPLENEQAVAASGRTPTGLLAELGALSQRTSVVHATHLTEDDITVLGAASATAVFCPTTEADLGDGIGPAKRLSEAGARIALGSDQNAVIDPFLEMRALEAGERLASRERGRFDPFDLLTAATTNGYRSLGLGEHSLQTGHFADMVEISGTSVRTAGSSKTELPMTATASDVDRVIIGGRVVAAQGRLTLPESSMISRRPENLLLSALGEFDRRLQKTDR